MKLTKKQEMILKLTKDFCEREIEPRVAEIDKTGIYPDDLVQKVKETGFLGCIFPKEYGGSDIDYVTYTLINEEISKYDISTAMIIGGSNSLSAGPIYEFGTKEQKEKYLKKICENNSIVGFGLTEPSAGSDAGGVQTTAVLDGDEWVLNGSKIFISNAGIADYYVIMASTDRTMGTRGISAFIVDYPTEGFTIGSYEDKMGIRGSHTGELVLQNVRIPKENLLGQLGKGLHIALETLDSGRIGVAANSIGLAKRALDEAVKYSKERVQFGKPICQNQAIAFMLADMETRLTAARLMTYDAAMKKQAKEPYAHEAAMAKYYASEAANYIADRAVQIHGGYGYTKDYVVERLFRDARILSIYEGTSEVQKIVISNYIIKRK